jgi:hypothetical protein
LKSEIVCRCNTKVGSSESLDLTFEFTADFEASQGVIDRQSPLSSDQLKDHFFQPVLFNRINNFMHRRKKKTNLHWYDEKKLEQKDKQHEKMTEEWLKENGLEEKTFHSLPLEQVQAACIANNLLEDFSRLLTGAQEETLVQYLIEFQNKRLRKGITQTQAYRVLNIGKKVNRKRYRKHRHKQA